MINALRFLCGLVVLLSTSAHAETFVVTRFDDPVEDGCLPTDCSLREAATAASTNDEFAGTDRIQLAAGTYTLIRGALRLGQDLELVGAGSQQTQITSDASLFNEPRNRMLDVRGFSFQTTDSIALSMLATTAVSRLALDDVVIPIDGGGVTVSGHDGFAADLEVRNSELHDSLGCNTADGTCTLVDSRVATFYVVATSLPGPSIAVSGSTIDGALDPANTLTGFVVHKSIIVEVEDSLITNTNEGLMIFNEVSQGVHLRRVQYLANAQAMLSNVAVDVEIDDSEFRDNPNAALRAGNASTWIVRGSSFIGNRSNSNAGGAVLVEEGASMNIENSTFSGNSFTVDAAEGGARGAAIGFRDDVHLDLLHVTIVPPAVMPVGIEGTAVGGYGGATIINVSNSILRGSCRLDAGAMHHNLGNIESGGDTCDLDAASNQISVDPDDLALGSLGNHGGPTPTYVPEEGSVAIDTGDSDQCLSFDQRGYARPFGDSCDVGATEIGAGDALFANGFD